MIIWTNEDDLRVTTIKATSILSLPFIALFACIIYHSSAHLQKHRKSLPSVIRLIITLEIFSNVVAIATAISFAFFYTNYLTNVNGDRFVAGGVYCTTSRVLSTFGVVAGKFIVYFIFAFRVYISFEGTTLALSKRIFVGITVTYAMAALVFVVVTLTAVFVTDFNYVGVDIHNNTRHHNHRADTADVDFVMCSRPDSDLLMIKVSAAFYTVVDFSFVTYSLVTFVKQLRSLDECRPTSVHVRTGTQTSMNTNTSANAITSTRTRTMSVNDTGTHHTSTDAGAGYNTDTDTDTGTRERTTNVGALSVTTMTASVSAASVEPSTSSAANRNRHRDGDGDGGGDGDGYGDGDDNGIRDANVMDITWTLDDNHVMHALVKKLLVLTVIAIGTSLVIWTFVIIIGGDYLPVLIFDVVSNAICLHLMHQFTNPIWMFVCGRCGAK